ncbi:hypothetical protein E2C01_011620 [Portunus trituberculatus]|uniref:Uncharacterized protein n=1 Tax=Portunus trituberculatus TaxID=210409 RepID=A0A5B7DBX7_PORTR|nr:hypothetical protein [Portunus trituberculatus]
MIECTKRATDHSTSNRLYLSDVIPEVTLHQTEYIDDFQEAEAFTKGSLWQYLPPTLQREE